MPASYLEIYRRHQLAVFAPTMRHVDKQAADVAGLIDEKSFARLIY